MAAAAAGARDAPQLSAEIKQSVEGSLRPLSDELVYRMSTIDSRRAPSSISGGFKYSHSLPTSEILCYTAPRPRGAIAFVYVCGWGGNEQ